MKGRCTIGCKSRHVEWARLAGLEGDTTRDAREPGLSSGSYYLASAARQRRLHCLQGDGVSELSGEWGSKAIGLTECKMPFLFSSDGDCRYFPALDCFRLRSKQ